ncbi:hypothetical protein DUNSADRAFT_18157 [Dunaliella salina]|uniref:Encoded protein n=1 Tax=Dunaliella salina TaxID=3046 RepID=A0ABQ7GZG2_DUNSA|nr:hypothetical protein DUNSADRAFT_18157 [Dunaliella salina]|eukprot:KAF5839997.1 hypothetical protein DUNSADRAFT_18157 [Dunaliella salina]
MQELFGMYHTRPHVKSVRTGGAFCAIGKPSYRASVSPALKLPAITSSAARCQAWPGQPGPSSHTVNS